MKGKIIKISLIVILLMMIFGTNIDARVTSTDPSVQSGGDVTITLKSSEAAYAYKITLADAGGLTFVSASSSAGQANGSSVNGASTSGVTTLATYKFKAPTVSENKKYSVKFNVSVSTDGESFTNTSNTSTVTVKAPVTPTTPTTPEQPQTPTVTPKSSDATLKSIKIGNKTYSGSSLKNTISYTVDSDVESIKISATKNDSKASVSGTGTKSLVAGETNKFKITVTAEDGTKKTYNVNIIRLAEETTTPNVIENETTVEEVKLALTSLVIKDVELNVEFNPETYNYIANVKNMKELEIVATANKEGAQINIEGAADLKEGDNIVKVIAILGEEKAEYIIDVYNVIEEEVIGIVEDTNIDSEPEDKNLVGMIQTIITNNLRSIVLIILVLILSIIAIRYVFLAYKYSNKLNELMGLNPETDSLDDVIAQQKSQNNDKEVRKIGRHF